ncbi:uncharacterized protein BP5553_09396 [Venustampulla echinocandica]|uniref:Uncharacterized protein n=1 Tax=Venustampulla echinocandica TaxID=2656787 RepID=A0A370TCN8_9HELO|nr:uncharacterized protein BP5553_09396 [Venustampulla echinocandica]RDL31994.1 hypothetical protein BP5553_09396 [Venustampulla echinocandica]
MSPVTTRSANCSQCTPCPPTQQLGSKEPRPFSQPIVESEVLQLLGPEPNKVLIELLRNQVIKRIEAEHQWRLRDMQAFASTLSDPIEAKLNEARVHQWSYTLIIQWCQVMKAYREDPQDPSFMLTFLRQLDQSFAQVVTNQAMEGCASTGGSTTDTETRPQVPKSSGTQIPSKKGFAGQQTPKEGYSPQALQALAPRNAMEGFEMHAAVNVFGDKATIININSRGQATNAAPVPDWPLPGSSNSGGSGSQADPVPAGPSHSGGGFGALAPTQVGAPHAGEFFASSDSEPLKKPQSSFLKRLVRQLIWQ